MITSVHLIKTISDPPSHLILLQCPQSHYSAPLKSSRLIEFSINRDCDRSVRFTILCFHVSIFAYLFQGALSELLYCKIRIQNSLKCAFVIDEQRRQQLVGHFVLPGKNAVLQPPLKNFQIRQIIFIRFSNMATNQATVNPPVPVTILKLRV